MKASTFFQQPFFQQPKYPSIILLALSLIAAIKQWAVGIYNNYNIFKYVFYHCQTQQSLYIEYPELYHDHNHYGPVFSLVIAPFALMPDALGMFLWNVANAAFLIWAVWQLPIKGVQKSIIFWIAAHELLTTSLSYQFNPSIAAIIIASYALIEKKQDFWAAMLIMLGTFVKLYGVVGLAFFFFSKQKLRFILSLLCWAVIFFCAPMLISSPEYIVNTYIEWYERLLVKNHENVYLSNMQDISLMGMVRKLFGAPNLPNLPFIICGLGIFALPYLRTKAYGIPKFRLLLVASVLIFTVIFSTASESPTYIIAFMGVAIWFAIQEKPSTFAVFLLIFALLLTSFSPSDLFPRYVREAYIKPYALKALPCILIWLTIVYEMMTVKTKTEEVESIS